MRPNVHGPQLLHIGVLDALQVGVEHLLEARPEQQRDAVEQCVQYGDAASLHDQSQQVRHLQWRQYVGVDITLINAR